MDKFEKALKKLSAGEQKALYEILARLKAGRFENLDIKKLKGSDDIFRVRQGNLRLIYQKRDEKIFLIRFERRSEKTYRNL